MSHGRTLVRVVKLKIHEGAFKRRRTMTTKENRGKDFIAVVNQLQHKKENKLGDHGSAEWVRKPRKATTVGHIRRQLQSLVRKP